MEINLFNLKPSTLIEIAADLQDAIENSTTTKTIRARNVLQFHEVVDYLESTGVKDMQGFNNVSYIV